MQFNTNPETGIRYTVYSMNSIDPDLQHELWYVHGKNLDEEAAFKEAYATAKAAAEATAEENGEENGEEFDELDFDNAYEPPDFMIDEPHIEGEYEGVKYGISWLGGAPNLWVWESPHKGAFALCSPCCPNACDGNSGGGYEGYAIPDDWLYTREAV